MTCPRCGYIMSPFDTDCPACTRKTVALPPQPGDPTMPVSTPIIPPSHAAQIPTMQYPSSAFVQTSGKPRANSWLAICLAIVCFGLVGVLWVFRIHAVLQSLVPQEPDSSPSAPPSRQSAPPVAAMPTAPPAVSIVPRNVHVSVQQLQTACARNDTSVIQQFAGQTVVMNEYVAGFSEDAGTNGSPVTIYLRGDERLYPDFACVINPGHEAEISQVRVGYGVVVRGQVDFATSGRPMLVHCDYVSASGIEPE